MILLDTNLLARMTDSMHQSPIDKLFSQRKQRT